MRIFVCKACAILRPAEQRARRPPGALLARSFAEARPAIAQTHQRGSFCMQSAPTMFTKAPRMKLLLINPNSTASMTDGIAGAARAVAAPGTQIVAVQPSFGPASIEGH